MLARLPLARGLSRCGGAVRGIERSRAILSSLDEKQLGHALVSFFQEVLDINVLLEVFPDLLSEVARVCNPEDVFSVEDLITSLERCGYEFR